MSSSLSSSVSSTVPAHEKPLLTFSAGSDNVLALSAIQTVKPPFNTGSSWNVSGGFKFGSVMPQPLSTTTTPSSTCGQQPTYSSNAAVDGGFSVVTVASDSTTLAHSAGSSALVSTTALWQCMPVAASPAAAAAVSHCENAVVTCSDRPLMSSCVDAVSARGLSSHAAAYDNSKFVSVAVTASHTLLASSPPTTFTQHPSSLFAFGQATFAQTSSRPLGVPSTCTSQFKAQSSTGL